MKTKGDVTVLVLVALGVLGLGAYLFPPKFLHGDTKRANASIEATAKVEAATTAQGASAAAGVVKIGEANATAAPSPAKEFIAKEVPAILSKLPPPDPAALLEAEKRRAAVMEGRAEEAARLYSQESARAIQLQKERDLAVAARRTVDAELATVAAERLAAEHQRGALIVIVILLVLAWAYVKFYSITPGAMGKIVADIRNGTSPIAAIDTFTPPWLHSRVRTASKLATEPKE